MIFEIQQPVYVICSGITSQSFNAIIVLLEIKNTTCCIAIEDDNAMHVTLLL